MSKMHEGHRKRVKQRFLSEGLEQFEEHQILEMILYFSIPYKDTNEIAHRLMDKYGSLWGVFEADHNDLKKIDGIGENSAVLINLIPSVARRYFKSRWGKKVTIKSSVDAGQYAVSIMTGHVYEVFYLICLDNGNKVNYSAIAHEGTINEAHVYPRIIVETALRHQARSVIFVHNHPGGSLRPSSADIQLTESLTNVLKFLSINVFDHIIVADGKYYSFAENGLIGTEI